MDYKKLVYHLFRNAQNSEQYKMYDRIQQKYGNENPYFGYIPSYPDNIISIVNDVIKHNRKLDKKKFIDIGCGLPIIPKIFDILGCDKSKGLEFSPLYVMMDYENFLIEGDLLTYDFGEYDILYSYCPIRNKMLMNKGIDNIIATMKKKAIFYFCDAVGLDEKNMKLFTNINNRIYKYTKT